MKCLWRLLYAFRSPVSRSFGQQSTVRLSQVKMAPYQGRETCFKCLKEEKEQAQPQLYGTPYFSVRIALTGLTQPVGQHFQGTHRESFAVLIRMLPQWPNTLLNTFR